MITLSTLNILYMLDLRNSDSTHESLVDVALVSDFPDFGNGPMKSIPRTSKSRQEKWAPRASHLSWLCFLSSDVLDIPCANLMHP